MTGLTGTKAWSLHPCTIPCNPDDWDAGFRAGLGLSLFSHILALPSVAFVEEAGRANKNVALLRAPLPV